MLCKYTKILRTKVVKRLNQISLLNVVKRLNEISLLNVVKRLNEISLLNVVKITAAVMTRFQNQELVKHYSRSDDTFSKPGAGQTLQPQ